MKRRLLRRKIKRGGFTLVEVVIAMLLTAIIVAGVFSLALTIRSGNKLVDRKLIADQSARQLTSVLKSYVTGDCRSSNVNGISAPNGSWSLSGLPSPNGGGLTIQDSCGSSCYALEPNVVHALSNFLPQILSNSGGAISYTVAYPGGGGAPCAQNPPVLGGPPSVNITVSWTNPAP